MIRALGSRRAVVIALAVGTAAVALTTVVVQQRIRGTSRSATEPSGVSPPGLSLPIASNSSPPTTAAPIARFTGATSVASFGADGRGHSDDTAAFRAAMTAALATPFRYMKGPSGRPQAVVWVPRGTYRIFQLPFLSNIRMEVDAGAVLEQAGNKALGPSQESGGPSLVLWDGGPVRPLTNVSMVGVGSAPSALKRLAAPVEPGWNIDRSFTFDLDTTRTGGDNYESAIQLANVDGFLIDDVYSIENGARTDPTDPVTKKIGLYPRPTSSRAVFVLLPWNSSRIGGPYYDPHNGAIRHHYNIGGPFGYGANQVTSGHNLTFSSIFSRGGIALRLETDATLHKSWGGELRGVVADGIVGVDCARAVSIEPHAQRNSDVHVSRVTARDCYQGVLESLDESSTLSDVQVIGGPGAQVPVSGHPGAWTVGPSLQAYARDSRAGWSVRVARMTCRGKFAAAPSPFDAGGVFRRPVCT